MFEAILPNRWLIWTIVLINIIALLLWWAVSLYTIDVERSISESDLTYIIRIRHTVAHQ